MFGKKPKNNISWNTKISWNYNPLSVIRSYHKLCSFLYASPVPAFHPPWQPGWCGIDLMAHRFYLLLDPLWKKFANPQPVLYSGCLQTSWSQGILKNYSGSQRLTVFMSYISKYRLDLKLKLRNYKYLFFIHWKITSTLHSNMKNILLRKRTI